MELLTENSARSVLGAEVLSRARKPVTKVEERYLRVANNKTNLVFAWTTSSMSVYV